MPTEVYWYNTQILNRSRGKVPDFSEKVFLAICTKENGTLLLSYYCPRDKIWVKIERINFECTFPHFVIFNEQIIFAGGSNGASAMHNVSSFNMNSLFSKKMPPMKTARINHSMAVCKGFVYAVGGKDTNTAERWSPQTKDWAYIPPMKRLRWKAGIAVLDHKLYVIGGYNHYSGNLKSVECYDPISNSWSAVTEMNKCRRFPGIAVVKGYIYAVGGYYYKSRPTATVERYVPSIKQWTMITSLSTPRALIGCSTLNDCLIAAGGCNGDTQYKSFEKYNDSTKKWTKLASMPEEMDLYDLLEVPKRFCIPKYKYKN